MFKKYSSGFYSWLSHFNVLVTVVVLRSCKTSFMGVTPRILLPRACSGLGNVHWLIPIGPFSSHVPTGSWWPSTPAANLRAQMLRCRSFQCDGRKRRRLGELSCGCIWPPTPASWVTSVKFLDFSKTWFLHLKNAGNPVYAPVKNKCDNVTSTREHRAWLGIGRCSATVTLFSFLMDRVVVNLYLIGETHSRLIRMS